MLLLAILIGTAIIGGLTGFALGSFWLVPVPFAVVWIWDASNGSHPDDDSIFYGLVLLAGTVGVLVGVLIRKFVRRARKAAA